MDWLGRYPNASIYEAREVKNDIRLLIEQVQG